MTWGVFDATDNVWLGDDKRRRRSRLSRGVAKCLAI